MAEEDVVAVVEIEEDAVASEVVIVEVVEDSAVVEEADSEVDRAEEIVEDSVVEEAEISVVVVVETLRDPTMAVVSMEEVISEPSSIESISPLDLYLIVDFFLFLVSLHSPNHIHNVVKLLLKTYTSLLLAQKL